MCQFRLSLSGYLLASQIPQDGIWTSTAGVARLPYCVFDINYNVKRDDIRNDISCDVFGNRRDHPEIYLGYVRWNGDYCSTAVRRSLAFKIIITLL